MNVRLLLVVGCIMLVLAQGGSAATIHGTVYDFSLNKVNGAVIHLNTTPVQSFIATDGAYRFTVGKGSYSLSAELMEQGEITQKEEKTIAIVQEGTYVIDFVLFPLIEEEDFEDIDVGEVADGTINVNGVLALLFTTFLAVIGVILWKRKNKNAGNRHEAREEQKKMVVPRAKESAAELEDVLAIIRKQGGRTTQKDIRKEIPLSEAKVSLMIAELEHKGKIEKIKKGRANIILLKK